MGPSKKGRDARFSAIENLIIRTCRRDSSQRKKRKFSLHSSISDKVPVKSSSTESEANREYKMKQQETSGRHPVLSEERRSLSKKDLRASEVNLPKEKKEKTSADTSESADHLSGTGRSGHLYRLRSYSANRKIALSKPSDNEKRYNKASHKKQKYQKKPKLKKRTHMELRQSLIENIGKPRLFFQEKFGISIELVKKVQEALKKENPEYAFMEPKLKYGPKKTRHPEVDAISQLNKKKVANKKIAQLYDALKGNPEKPRGWFQEKFELSHQIVKQVQDEVALKDPEYALAISKNSRKSIQLTKDQLRSLHDELVKNPEKSDSYFSRCFGLEEDAVQHHREKLNSNQNENYADDEESVIDFVV